MSPLGSCVRVGASVMLRRLGVAWVLALTGCAAAPAPVKPSPSTAHLVAAAPPPASGLRLDWPVWIGVVCDDLQAQRRFYRDVLGLEERHVTEGSVWYMFDGKILELLQKSERAQYARRGVAVGFLVADIRAARALLVERGVEPVSDIEGGPAEYWAYFRDAEGNLFEIVQAPR
jgi:catechol 2,3-dioxygenase-like lactoylglutathione lyase family enzyme